MRPLLSFEGVSCRRGGRLLCQSLDVELGPGEALQVVGPNGSGKSSLIRLAAGLLKPDSGSVQSSALALADDNLALDRERSLASALGFWGGDVAAGLAAIGLSQLAGVPVRFLSAGQAKRAALARVIGSEVPLWLLDEPVNALDSQALGMLAKAIDAHRGAGGAIVAASHSILPGQWQTLELGR